MTWPTLFDSRLENYNPMDFPGQQLSSSNAITPFDHALNLNIDSAPGCQRLTGILASLGQRSYDAESFEKMMEAGMNITSINMSFGSREYHLQTINMLREAARNFSVTIGRYYPLAIAIRLSGRKIKTGRIAENCGNQVELITDEVVRLTTDETYKDRCSTYTIFVDFKDFAEQMNPRNLILLDNGTITLKVEVISSSTLTCKVQSGGILGSYKDVFTPNVAMNMPHYTEKDKDDIKMAINNGVDIIIASFVNSADTIIEIRKVLGDKGKHIALIANIQQSAGLNNIDEILKVADGIMILRQDLGMDMKPERLIIVQKNIIARAHQANVPVCLGIDFQGDGKLKRTPLRSELLDLGNCILDGVDCVRFCPEVIEEVKPEAALALLSDTCKAAEDCYWSQKILLDCIDKTLRPCEHSVAAAMAAVFAAQKCLASAIIVVTNSGKVGKIISKYQPRCPIVTVSRYPRVSEKLHLYKGIIPLYYDEPAVDDWTTDIEKRYNFGIKFAIDRGFVKMHDPVVIVYGWKRALGDTNTMKVIYVTQET